MQPDHVYCGRIVSSNGRREPGRLRYQLWGVRYGPELLDRVVWDLVTWGPDGGADFLAATTATDQMNRVVGSSRYAAAAVVAVQEPGELDPPHNRWPGPVAAVVVDFYADPNFTPPGEPASFPGLSTLRDALEVMYPRDDGATRVTVTEKEPTDDTPPTVLAGIPAPDRPTDPAA